MSVFSRIAILMSLCGLALLNGQIGGGSIVGVVRDPSGAPVTGVKILAQNLDTNQQHRIVTNDEGYYEYPLLPAGRYNLEAEAAGFERVRIQAFDLATGTRPRLRTRA